MPTIRVNADAPDRATLGPAAELLRSGGIVAFPTETVYGLGANALDPAAVQRIYEAKGRPAVNPLIVHVASVAMARDLSEDWTPLASRLAEKFWPGPLTLVVRRTARIPDDVTAGGETVGLRMPAHPVALALIELAGVPVAAPSANLSNQISPTTAAHVERGLGDRVDVIVDGGATSVGIESTVVDVTGTEPRILRPGVVTADDIANAAQAPVRIGAAHREELPRSPGMLGKHYAPRARVELFGSGEAAEAAERAAREHAAGRRVGALVFRPLGVAGVLEHVMPGDARGYARRLYASLHEVDDAGCALVLVEDPPRAEEWRGVRDRLERAARA